MLHHRQVFVKVNAPVDEGIAALVEALNQFDGIITLDSCQRGREGAYVYFTFGVYLCTQDADWRQLAEFVERLSADLRDLNLCCGYSLRLEWFGSNEQPRAQLVLNPEYVAAVATKIREAALSGSVRLR